MSSKQKQWKAVCTTASQGRRWNFHHWLLLEFTLWVLRPAFYSHRGDDLTCHGFFIHFYLHDLDLIIIVLENILQAAWMFLVMSFGGAVVWLCLARVEQSYPNMVKLGKGLPLKPAFSWGFSAWTHNVSQSLILERMCEHYSLPIVCNQTVLLLFINKQLTHYKSLFQ